MIINAVMMLSAGAHLRPGRRRAEPPPKCAQENRYMIKLAKLPPQHTEENICISKPNRVDDQSDLIIRASR
jgi:hypothetical protein